jgi:CAAX protease family protein
MTVHTSPLAWRPDQRATRTTTADVPLVELPTARLLALHLVPGLLTAAAYIALKPVVDGLSLPAINALLGAILLVLLPIELGILVRAGRAAGGIGLVGSIRAVVPYRQPLTRRGWLVFVPTLVASFTGFGIAMMLDAPIIAALFGWLPPWFLGAIALDNVHAYSSAAWAVTIAAYFVLNGFVGPITEELYFRGYLLPRMARFGQAAPLLNVALFSLYHLWSPWQFFARLLGVTPWAYAVWWKRNVYLGMAVHCALNVGSVTLFALIVMGRL